MRRTVSTRLECRNADATCLLCLPHVAFLIVLSLTAMCWVGCRTDEDAVERLGGTAEPYRDSCYLRVTFRFAEDDTLRSIAGMDKIVVLDLTGSSISDEGLKYLGAMQNLNEVVLTNTRVTDAGMKYLIDIGRGKDGHPLELTLDKTAVTDEGIRTLASMENLASLSLKGTQVTDASLRCLQGTNSLGGLGLDRTRITDNGLAMLVGLELSWLSLRDTRVSDTGLKYLHLVKTLQQIDLGGTRVTPEGIKELERAIPGVQVEHVAGADSSTIGVPKAEEAWPKTSCR